MEGQIKCCPDKVKLKEFIITKPLLYAMLKDLSTKKKIKNRSSKNDSKLTVINDHIWNKNKRKLSKQLEQEQNHRNGDHMKGYQ